MQPSGEREQPWGISGLCPQFRESPGKRREHRFGSVFPAVASKTVEDVLFPGIDVRVERVSNSSDVLVVEAVSTARPGRCPDCRKQPRRVHSTYQRTLDERSLGSRRSHGPAAGAPVLLRPE